MHTLCNAGYAGSILGQGAKILQTSRQLNLCAPTTEAVLESLCSAMRRPCATAKTQSSQTKELKSENGEGGRPASAGLGTSPRCLRGRTCTYYCQPYPGVSECVHLGAPGRGGRGWCLPLRHLSTCLGATVRRNGTSACGSPQLPNGAHPAGKAETSARRERPTKDRREAAEDGSLNPNRSHGNNPQDPPETVKGNGSGEGRERMWSGRAKEGDTRCRSSPGSLPPLGERHSPASGHSRPHLTSSPVISARSQGPTK